MKKNKHALKKLIIGSFMTLFSIGILNAATYYVGPSGNNGNDGLSPSTAFNTIQYAVEYVASHGGPQNNNVILLEGSWPQTVTINDVPACANWTSNLLIQGINSNVRLYTFNIYCKRLTIKGIKITQIQNFYPGHYSRLEDIVGVGQTWWNITASNITWLRCKATDSFSADADVVRIAADGNDPAKVPTNILLQDCCFKGSSISPGNHIDVIQTLGVKNLTLKNCNIWNAPTGVFMPTILGVPIDGLLFEDCYFGARTFYMGNVNIRNVTVRNCKFAGSVYYKQPAGTNSWTGNEFSSWSGQVGGGTPFPSVFENNIVKTTCCALPANNTLDPNLVIPMPSCPADEPDFQAPSVPTGLTAGSVTGTTIALSWNASTDDNGVTGYKVYINGSNPVSVGGTSTTLTGLNPVTQYSLTVSAYDASGNESAQSSALNTTTAELDTQVPSVPTGLSTGTVTTSSVALSWSSSTDNVGVTGYKVYINGANPENVTGTSATINNLADNTQYSFTVSALDAEGNESAQSSAVNATTLELTGVISSGTWQSFTESTQTGTFTATFDAIPSASGIDAVTGIQNGTAGTYSDLACIVRFNTSGQIDARNGSLYAASNTISYTSGVNYHFRVEIDVPAHTYSVFVTPQGGSEQTVASNFAFRTEQASVSQLTGWSVYALSGSHAVDNMTFSTGGGSDTQAPSVPTSLTAGTITTNSVALSWTASTDNVGVTGYKVYTNGSNPVSVGGTSTTIGGLSASTQYSFTVSAYDAAGNESAQSSAINVTTQSGGSITEYYVDPATGSMSNPGTSSQPWSTLEAVFTAGKTFQPGDVIYLRNGYHGYPTVTGNNSDYVTITAQAGHTPGVKKLNVSNASKWVISGLNVSPELVGSYERGDFVTIQSTSSYITIDNCYIYSAQSISGWSSSDMSSRLGNGIAVNGPNCLITNNLFKQTNFTLTVNKTSTGTSVTYNTIEGFMGDGIRGLASYCNFEYNVVKTCYGVDSNHDDAFQSWSTNASGTVGAGTVYDIVIRGNMFINQVSASQPFPPNTYGMQGIGNFDGFFENWVIENNLVVTDMWHGLSFYGARNCKIINNTVVKNAINILGDTPWIAVYNHKNGTASTGNIMNNNLTCDIESTVGCSVNNNIISSAYTTHFVDYAGYDFRLQPTSSAVNGGTISNAPTIDLNQYPRSGNPDVGCYELGSGTTGGDTEAPSVPTNLSAGTVTTSSVTLSWIASTDNVGVAGYKVYTNGSNPVTTTGTSTTVTGLADNTAYAFTVSAYDAAGNESAQSSSVNATTLEQTGITSSSAWQSFAVSTQTGTFTATFDAVPNGSNMDGVTGILNGTASGYGDLACIVRFNSSGQIDARNGGSYAATNTVNYSAGTNYHFRVEIDVPAHTYSVYATPQGGSEQTVASNFAFRSEQASVSQLTGWSLYAYIGSHTVSNMNFSTGGGDTQAPSVPTSLTAGTITTNSVALSWTASTDNVGVTGYKVYTNGSNPVTVGGTSTTISGLTQATQYSFTVSAIDAAENESAQSSAIQVTTLDTQAPSVPIDLSAGTVTTSSVALSWTASTDNVGVTGYKVYTNGSNPVTVGGTSTTISGLAASTQYSFTVSAIDAATNESAQSAAEVVTTQGAPVTGTITRDYWTNISGSTVPDLVNNANYPNNPTGSDELTTLEGVDWNNPSDANTWAQNYGERIYGYLHPQTTGNYTFWLSGDDRCDLYLSTDDNPANKVKIAYLSEHSNFHSWSEFASQKSAAISLVAGQTYFIEALHKESYGNDYIAAAWSKPGESTSAPSEIIPGSVLSPYASQSSFAIKETGSANASVVIYPNPLNGNTLNIKAYGFNEANVIIYNIMGEMVYNQSHSVVEQTELQIPVNNLNKGVYIISVNRVQQKLIVE